MFNGKTVLVTGGTSGIGYATAKAVVDHGGKVIITGRNSETLSRTASELGSEKVDYLQIDQSKMSEVMTLAEKLKEITPKLDGVFLNAGSGDFSPIEYVSEEHFDKQFNNLVKGTFFSAQQTLSLMESGSSIVFNVSVVTERGMQGTSVYSAAKGAVKSLIKTFGSELAPKGIRVNGVFPGPIETAFFESTTLSEEQRDGFASSVTAQVPLGRFGKSEEVANAVLFLLSDQASYIHGIELAVDGGMTQY